MESQSLIPIDLIDHNPYQPRQIEDPEAIAELAASIKHNGLMQVPSARQVDGRYQLAFGHTRMAAFKLNGETCMPLIVRDLTDLQMFELGVAENIKRRDLNYVEKAEAMQRYMEEFEKNSAETAEFFNTTAEDVRGTVRLNNLPPAAKEKLARGEITVTTARTLLSLQKIAPREVINETLTRLEKGKDRWGNEETPDEAIDEVLSNVDDIQEMWGVNREGKPLSGWNGWLLNMKNFPNKYLPVLTPVDAAIALGIQDDEDMMEKVGIWIDARTAVVSMVDIASLGIPDELIEKLEHLVDPPACSSCPFFSNVNGTHYCGMKTCWTRKGYAWEKEKLRAASKDLKIEIYNAEEDGEYRVCEDNYTDNGKKHHDLFVKRSKDLRLALSADIDRKKRQSGYHGVPESCVVMIVGPTLKKLLETGQKERSQKRSKEQAAAILANVTKEKQEALHWEVAAYVKVLFDSLNLAALDSLWDAPGRYSSDWTVNRYTFRGEKPAKDADVATQEEYLRRLIALNMVIKIGGSYNKSISEYAAHLSEKVKEWGVKLPKSVTQLAAQMDDEIKAVTTETAEEEK